MLHTASIITANLIHERLNIEFGTAKNLVRLDPPNFAGHWARKQAHDPKLPCARNVPSSAWIHKFHALTN